MDRATHVAHLREDSAALLAAYRADPAGAVPTCPGWDRAALLAHVARTHAWVHAQLAAGPQERVRFGSVPHPPEGDALDGWYEAGANALADALAAMDVEATWPTWAGPQPGSFYPRRMALETAIHRRDADPCPVDPALAVDGIDELLEIFVPLVPPDRLEGRTGSLHLHATDTAGEWVVHFTAGGIRSEHGHAKGDAALRGTASDLYLWGWNRVPVDDRFEAFGDTGLLELWRSSVAV